MLKLILFASVMALAISAPAAGQSLRLPTIAFGSAASADWVATYQAHYRGTRERNPTINWLWRRPALMVATGAAMDVAGVYAWQRYVGRRHPKIAAVGLYAAAGFRLWLAVDNNRSNRHNGPPCRASIPLACS